MTEPTEYPGMDGPLVERIAWARYAGVMSQFAKKALEDAEAALREQGDEHHTLDELYEYRMLYNALVFNEWERHGTYPVVKSMQHSDGEDCFGGGWFVVVAELPTGQISNHYRLEHWDLFQVRSVALPPEYDGHTPADAAKRMLALLSHPTSTSVEDQIDAGEMLMQRHYLDPVRFTPDGGSYCVCGGWVEGEMEPTWDRHLLDVLTDAGWTPPSAPKEGI